MLMHIFNSLHSGLLAIAKHTVNAELINPKQVNCTYLYTLLCSAQVNVIVMYAFGNNSKYMYTYYKCIQTSLLITYHSLPCEASVSVAKYQCLVWSCWQCLAQ